MTSLLPQTQDTILDTGLQYFVKNNTLQRLTTGDGRTDLLRWDRVSYRCEPGAKVIVPWAVIALYFGDPRSQHGRKIEASDSRGTHVVPPRGNELLRLSVFYGVYEDGVGTLPLVVPDVTITTLEGVEIIPPCFDPEGEFVYGFQRNMQRSDDVATLIEQMQEDHAQMQRQIDALKNQQAAREVNGNNDAAIPEDNPQVP